MSKIFISYRRSDSIDVTGRIYDTLVKEFGYRNIFKDVDDIRPGEDFRVYIRTALAKAKVVIVVIGPTWVSERLNDARDCVRQEIETALELRLPTIPVTVTNASMPDKAALSSSLYGLADLNAQPIRPDPDFHKDMARLVREVEKLGVKRRKEHTNARRIVTATATLLVVGLLVFALYLYLRMTPPSQLVVDYGLAYPKLNVSRGELDAEWGPCSGQCLQGVTKCVHLTGSLEERGFAVLNLWKPSNLLGVWSAQLPRRSLYFRIAASDSGDQDTLNVEIAVKDSEKDEAHFKCTVPTDDQPRNFVIPAGEFVDARVDLNELELISIGSSWAAGASPGPFRMSLFGISTQPVKDATTCDALW